MKLETVKLLICLIVEVLAHLKTWQRYVVSNLKSESFKSNHTVNSVSVPPILS